MSKDFRSEPKLEDVAENDLERVGYGKPPKSGQFKKGRSGNPAGRPRNAKDVPPIELPAAAYPTRVTLRREAQRKVKIRDGTGEHEIPVREAVIRATSMTALKGSVFAQRSLLEQFHREDERFHQEQLKRFELWLNYKIEMQPLIDKARQTGVERDDILPHPEDIELDDSNLSVRFLGAQNRTERASERIVEQVQALAYEMMVFTDEVSRYRMSKGKPEQIGLYMALYLLAYQKLPPRLKLTPDKLTDMIQRQCSAGHTYWERDLRARCSEAEFPFITTQTRLINTRQFFRG